MRERILKILQRVPPKHSYSELIKCAIEDDTSISDLVEIYEQFYELIDDLFDALEVSEDEKTTYNRSTNTTRN